MSYQYKYSIVCCARWEQEDVLEWVLYHKAVGFDHIYLFSNDDDPMPTFKVLTPFLFGEVAFITFKHFPKPHPEAAQQPEIYQYFLDNYKNETEWFTFIDVDEFFVFKNVDDVHVFMREFEQNADAVYFNWLLYGHAGKLTRDHESLLLSHTERAQMVDTHTKIITRSSKIVSDDILSRYFDGTQKKGFWHFWSEYEIPGLRETNVIGYPMEGYVNDFPNEAANYVLAPKVSSAILAKGYIAHFQFRSETDILRRVKRGGSLTNALWKSMIDAGTYINVLNGRSDVFDSYLAAFWLRQAGNAYDIKLSKLPFKEENIAIRRPCIQSSVHRQASDDPQGSFAQGHANNGIVNGTYGFRTTSEERAWWMIDLLSSFSIRRITIYRGSLWLSDKSGIKIGVEISQDLVRWHLIHSDARDQIDVKVSSVLELETGSPCLCRYLRVTALEWGQLYLDEVEIYASTI